MIVEDGGDGDAEAGENHLAKDGESNRVRKSRGVVE